MPTTCDSIATLQVSSMRLTSLFRSGLHSYHLFLVSLISTHQHATRHSLIRSGSCSCRLQGSDQKVTTLHPEPRLTTAAAKQVLHFRCQTLPFWATVIYLHPLVLGPASVVYGGLLVPMSGSAFNAERYMQVWGKYTATHAKFSFVSKYPDRWM